LERLVREHLAAHGHGDIEVGVTLAGAATRLDVDSPWVAWASRSIVASGAPAPTVLPNLAGSLPNDAFADLLGLPTLWVPHSYPACSQHAPNEHLLAPVAREGLQLMAGLYWDLGEPAGSPGAAPWATAPPPVVG
jgi:predicted RNase H-like nuclease